MKLLLSIVVLASAVCAAGQPWSRHAAEGPRPLLLDAHEDTLLRLRQNGANLGDVWTLRQSDLPKWLQGGVNAVLTAVWIDPHKFSGAEAAKEASSVLDLLYAQAAMYPDKVTICETAAAIKKAVASSKIALVPVIEGGIAINDNLSLIEKYRERGVRYMTLTWRDDVTWAGSSESAKPEKGLSDFGRKVVREMNRVGMVVDLSHASDKTFYDALAVSTKPVIASHSNSRVLCDHPRNLTDDMLRALAKNGGVAGINFCGKYLLPESKFPLQRKEAGVKAVLDHIDHIVSVAGIDHVGIGTDYDGGIKTPPGVETAAELQNVVQGLRSRGYSETDIEKICSGNFLRVLGQNE